MDDDVLTVSEAAQLLGLHPNTIRYRIKTGAIAATKVLSPQGPMSVISREELSKLQALEARTTQAPNGRRSQKSDSVVATNNAPSNTADLEALTHHIVAPFVAHLEDSNRAIGRLEAERDQALSEVAQLKERLTALEHPVLRAAKPWWKFWR